jgi:cation transport regulator
MAEHSNGTQVAAPEPSSRSAEHEVKNYQEVEELPQPLRDELPQLAQELYLAVHRATWERCAVSGEAEEQLARKAHEAAMLAVEEKFAKDERGRWHHAPAGAAIDKDKMKGEKLRR